MICMYSVLLTKLEVMITKNWTSSTYFKGKRNVQAKDLYAPGLAHEKLLRYFPLTTHVENFSSNP